MTSVVESYKHLSLFLHNHQLFLFKTQYVKQWGVLSY
jgi:hypothetical protein